MGNPLVKLGQPGRGVGVWEPHACGEWASRGAGRTPGTRSRPSLWRFGRGVPETGWMKGHHLQVPSDVSGCRGQEGPDQLEAKPRGPSPGWQETAEHIGDRMPMVLGRGWIEAAVPTLHCSSLDSVFLSPIYTLSVQQAALQPANLNSPSLSLHLDHTCLPPAHFSPPVPRPTSHLQSLQGSISGSLSPPPTPSLSLHLL